MSVCVVSEYEGMYMGVCMCESVFMHECVCEGVCGAGV